MGKGRPRRGGMRRSYLKRYSASMVNTGSSPNAAVVAEYAARPQAFRKAFHQKVEDIPVTIMHGKRGLTMARAEGENAVPLAQVMVQRWQSSLRTGHGVTEFYRIEIINIPNYKLDLWFGGREFIFFRESDKLQARSLVYSSRDKAMREFKLDRIIWDEVYTIPK